VGSTCNFECASTGDYAPVFDGVLNGSQSVSDGILDLGDGVSVGTFNDEGDGFR